MSKGAQFILILIAFLYFIGFVYIQEAYSHSWYDKWCCNEKDCAPVIKMIRHKSNKGWLMTSKHGTAFVPDNPKLVKMLPSEDSNVHICIGNFEQNPYSYDDKAKESSGYARCVYWPVS